VSVWTVQSDQLDTLLFTSRAADGDWKCLDYPSPYPGWTAIQILQMCLSEAQARGELTGWMIDDNGHTYPQIEEFAARVGDPLITVIDALTAAHIDVAVDHTSLTLQVWPKSVGVGSATSVELERGVNVTYLSRTTSDEITNAVLGVWQKGVRWRTRSSSITAYGRRAGSLEVGQVGNRRALDQILDAYLDAHAEPAEQIVARVIPTTGARAGVNYKVGDTVSLEGDTVRDVGLEWTLQPDGDLLATPEFDSVFGVRQRERLRTVDRLIQAFDAPATSSILDRDALLNSGVVDAETKEVSWAGRIEESLDDEDPDNPWQPIRLDKARRIYQFEVEIPAVYASKAVGTTTVQLLKNGSVLHTLSMGAGVTYAGTDVSVSTVILPKDLLSVRCTATGSHIDGAIRILLADPV